MGGERNNSPLFCYIVKHDAFYFLILFDMMFINLLELSLNFKIFWYPIHSKACVQP